MISFWAPIQDFVKSERTELTADVTSGSDQTMNVSNNEGFSLNNYIMVGREGFEKAEITKISNIPTGNTQIKAPLKFSHSSGEPITKIAFNQRKLYRATSKTGTYSFLSTKDIEIDKPQGTYFEDLTGTSSNWYKCTYYNSTTTTETSLDDAEAVQGGDVQHYASVYDIRRMAGFEENYAISDLLINDFRDAAEDIINSRIGLVYSLPLSYVPKIVTLITQLITAGQLLMKEYGVEENIEIAKSGARMTDTADKLLGQIVSGDVVLLDSEGSLLGRSKEFTVTGSNVYNGITADLGEMFNLADEHFRMKNPDRPKG